MFLAYICSFHPVATLRAATIIPFYRLRETLYPRDTLVRGVARIDLRTLCFQTAIIRQPRLADVFTECQALSGVLPCISLFNPPQTPCEMGIFLLDGCGN